ncbi:unnamed protein product [Boreogadus saida]
MVSILVISTIIYKPRPRGQSSAQQKRRLAGWASGRGCRSLEKRSERDSEWSYTYSLTPPKRVELHLQADTTQQSGATPTAQHHPTDRSYTYRLTPPNRVELHLQPDTTQQTGATPTARHHPTEWSYTYSLTPPNRPELHLQPDTTQQTGATPTA